jgi:lysophospholipase L1-like esterase
LRAAAARLVLVLVGLAAGLAAVELGLRLLPSASSSDVRGLHELRPDRPWLYGMRPGAEMRGPGGVRYQVNADGFRDRGYARPKPAGTFRIVVLGHSVAFGWGVTLDDTYPKLFEARLAELAPGKRIEVLNLGVSGYNAYTESALFRDVGIGYEPDLVMVEFGINDLNDPTLHFDAQTAARLHDIPDEAFPNPALRRPPPPPPSRWERLCRWSRLCSLVAARPALPADAGLLGAALVPHDDPSAAELAWLRARYDEIAAAAAGIGARFAVVVFPYAAQVDGRAPHRVQERLATLAHDAGWPTVDLLPVLRDASRDATPLFLDPWHLTPRGNRVVADALAARFRCLGLLPLPAGDGCADVAGSTAACRRRGARA